MCPCRIGEKEVMDEVREKKGCIVMEGGVHSS